MLSITTRFYRSTYITLGLACACLGYAELPFLPEMTAFAAVVAVLLVIAYWLEGRWALSICAANILGGVIGASPQCGWHISSSGRTVHLSTNCRRQHGCCLILARC